MGILLEIQDAKKKMDKVILNSQAGKGKIGLCKRCMSRKRGKNISRK